ncbi:MAG: hypothetical protein IT550_08575 [Novosphingobium sp.]|jgi:hypothetical protein|nr:hypothetical protein [Novosphingobium sp.]
MGTMLIIGAAFALPLLLWLFMSLVAAWARVWRGGVADAREFDRADFSLRRFFRAQVDRQDSSSLVPTRAGIGLRYEKGQFKVRKTRTVSKDVF